MLFKISGSATLVGGCWRPPVVVRCKYLAVVASCYRLTPPIGYVSSDDAKLSDKRGGERRQNPDNSSVAKFLDELSRANHSHRIVLA